MNKTTVYKVEAVGKRFNVINSNTNSVQSSWNNKLDAHDTANRLNKLLPREEMTYENNVIPLFD